MRPPAATTSPERAGTLVRALLVCDLCDSAALTQRLGDQRAAALFRQHDRVARSLLSRWHGREIDKSDGFFLLFERPIQAVAFALEYRRELDALSRKTGEALSARVGIHVGEVLLWQNAADDVAGGAKPLEVEGLAKAIASRLMGLAGPGRILVSGTAHALAHHAERDCAELGSGIRWIPHGAYRLKGVPDAIEVHEAIGGDAPAPPTLPDSAKAWRVRPWWHMSRARAVGALAMLIAGAVVVAMWLRSEPALAFAERDWVVLGDLVDVNADRSLDGALSSAFRIGLEQSRFVNVLPEMQVRDALLRMQRKADTRIDRSVASEIALREQARAVILPSVAQYGQRLRLSAELVDPNGARTVLTRSADAVDANEVLPALDRLLQDLRTTLGESLAQIRSTTQPLQKVTTSNLDALRALSSAVQMMRDGRFEDSRLMLKHATELDPGFATAYADMGSVLMTLERYPEARVALEKAASLRDRMTEREHLFVKGLAAEYADPSAMLEAWQAYAQLYPEYGTGQYNVGYVRYLYLNDYTSAESELRQAAETRVPLRNYAFHLLGHALLAQEKLDSAEKAFRAALSLSQAPGSFGLADAMMASGNLDGAQRYLESWTGDPLDLQADRNMHVVTLLVLRQRIAEAASANEAVRREAARIPAPSARWRAEAAAIALRFAQGDVEGARDLAATHLADISSTTSAEGKDSKSWEQLLYAAAWAARLGLIKEARDALDAAAQFAQLDRWPVRASMATVAQAELDLADGRPRDALARSASMTPDLWEAHEVRSRAMRALDDAAGEAVELRWLLAHRGLAHAQWTDEFLGQQARMIALLDASTRLARLPRAT